MIKKLLLLWSQLCNHVDNTSLLRLLLIFYFKLIILLCFPLICIGSGSSYLYGFLDQAWKEGMTKEEAELYDDFDIYFNL